MATKIKGLYKSFKFISQIFVKEREMEIGYPTDVKHVTHVGWDGSSDNAPSWMNEFKSPPDFSTALGGPKDSNSVTFSPWTSQADFDQHMGDKSVSSLFNNLPPSDLQNVPKKLKRKKKATSPKSSSSSSRSLRTAKSKSACHELESLPNLQATNLELVQEISASS